MQKTNYLASIWQQSKEFERLQNIVRKGEGPCVCFGVPETPAMFLSFAIAQATQRQAVLVVAQEKEARNLCDEINALQSKEDLNKLEAVFLPSREIQLAHYSAHSREISTQRIAALCNIIHKKAKIVVLCPQTLMQAMPPPEAFILCEINIQVGQSIQHDKIIDLLIRAGYERVERVDAAGQFRLSGAILDVFATGREHAFRVEFWDDEIDSIRLFDPSTQRSIEKVNSAYIPPATEVPFDEGAKVRAVEKLSKTKKTAVDFEFAMQLLEQIQTNQHIANIEQIVNVFYEDYSVMDFFNEDVTLFISEPNRIEQIAQQFYGLFLQNYTHYFEKGDALKIQEKLVCDELVFWKKMDTKTTVLFQGINRSFSKIREKALFKFQTRASTMYGAQIEQFSKDAQQIQKSGSQIIIFAGKRAQPLFDNLQDFDVNSAILKEINRDVLPKEIIIVEKSISKGFECAPLKIAVFGEEDIYGSRKKTLKPKKRKSANKLDIFADLSIGDYVVHEVNGVGIFKGIEKQSVLGVTKDFLIIQYSGSSVAGVSTDQLDRVQKYIGGKDKAPKLSSLETGDFQRAISKVRAAVKELAFDLVELYAKRKAQVGFAFSNDNLWQKQLEQNFAFEETPDQLQCIEEIKADMQSTITMDRLLCGDVGYGKTEVALRAAFKAAQDSKQVAVLVPTTILAQQHYQTFVSRFEDFPVNVELLCRFRTPKQQKQTLDRLEKGLCDVVIGTHRLLGKQIKYRDLGLLIIDEEQRFGVAHKEQFKNLKANIDVLTLSATPIPRTLHMSMVGIRDMSVIETPPEERFPVQTFVVEYSDMLVREAILKEINRGGQVYILYNNVVATPRYIQELSKLVPEATLAMANGQMSESQLEKTMMSLMEGEIDVLVCSTIIESGLDVSNVNTIIIRDSDKLGLSQLYQLRGRVGRTNRLAYAYLTFAKDKVLTDIAQQRLTAIREFTDFGSGFKLAMRDLEIRGAGDILGANQHGHMDDVGYDMYCKLVDEAVSFAKGDKVLAKVDTQIDIMIDAFIPKSYIKDESQRLEIYKRIAFIESQEEMLDVQEEIEDRFSDIPETVQNLMNIAVIKALASKAGIVFVGITTKVCKLKFHAQHTENVDGHKLFELVNKIKNAKVLKTNKILVMIEQPNMTIKQYMGIVFNFLTRLLGIDDVK